MKKYISIYIITLVITSNGLFSQFTKSQMDELTAKGIYEAIEENNASVIAAAEEITAGYNDSNYIQKLCAVFDHVNRSWKYRSDPGGMEYFERAGISVYTYTGDCDDYATLMISLVKALGGDGRVVCVSGHAYPEIYLGKNLSEADLNFVYNEIDSYYSKKGSRTKVRTLNYHSDDNGTYWLNFDYQERYPGGRFAEYSPFAEHLVIYSNGSYELSYLNKQK